MQVLVSSLTGFYNRRKSPWIGFILVLVLGPFGFLYHSWKTALAVLLVVLPLWIGFLRHTRFDLIDNTGAHYVALLALAGFASLQIKAQRATRRPLASAETSGADISDLQKVALSLMPNEVEKRAFQEYFGRNPMLAEKLRKNIGRKDDQITQYEITTTLNSYALVQADAKDFPGASSSLLYSLIILEENPLTWAEMAEVYCAWEDMIAARWAQKVCDFDEPQPGASQFIKDLYSEGPVLGVLRDMKERMQQIIHICSEHPEWRDTYPMKKGLYKNL